MGENALVCGDVRRRAWSGLARLGRAVLGCVRALRDRLSPEREDRVSVLLRRDFWVLVFYRGDGAPILRCTGNHL